MLKMPLKTPTRFEDAAKLERGPVTSLQIIQNHGDYIGQIIHPLFKTCQLCQ